MRITAALVAFGILTSGGAAFAQAADPAAAQIEGFDNALLSTMKSAKTLGFEGRRAKLEPAVEQALDLPLMTRIAVGPAWAGYTDAQHAALVKAFGGFTVASYAHNFDGYSGETFTLDPNVQTRGPDKIVKTTLIVPRAAPVTLTYRMRNSGAGWKVIDVFYNGTISELTTRRSDFAAASANGAQALVEHLDQLTARISH